MSTLSNPSTSYKVIAFDADSTVSELSDGLTKQGGDGWKLVNSYHLHHLNQVFFVFSSETGVRSA